MQHTGDGIPISIAPVAGKLEIIWSLNKQIFYMA